MANAHQPSLFPDLEPLPDGAHHLRGFLTLDEQKEIVATCLAGGFYHAMGKKDFQMYCLGRHWTLRGGYDDVKVPAVPPSFMALASRAAAEAVGMPPIQADIAIVNWYEAYRGMDLHPDDDESPETREKGIPVVSISLGDEAMFLFGGARKDDPTERVRLYSGDAFVWGGTARMFHHGISRVYPGTGPKDLGFKGRINITLRQY
jgi:DNA oxidative demethylase